MADKKSMPSWFAPALAFAAVAVVLSGLNLLKVKGQVRDSEEK